jgi:hypothetical protein
MMNSGLNNQLYSQNMRTGNSHPGTGISPVHKSEKAFPTWEKTAIIQIHIRIRALDPWGTHPKPFLKKRKRPVD